LLGPRVAIAKGIDPSEMVRQAISLLQVGRVVRQGDRVLIKPNCVADRAPSTGVTTDPRIVEELILYANECGAKEVVVADGGSVDTEKVFETTGLKRLARKYGVRVIDLNRDEKVRIRIPNATALREVDVAKTALDYNCIINVPKLKVHHIALVTLAIKNLMGIILPKSIIHTDLHEKLSDLATFFKPRLNVIDGTIGSEIDEVNGRPVQMNLVIAGVDIVATDSVGAAVMGINPQKVRHIALSESRGVGCADLHQIHVVGESIERVKKNFELPPEFRGSARGNYRLD
jgi:uncharacterized protein (DUF362 family)